MTSAPDRQLDRLFSALSDPTRRAILSQLMDGEATVSDLAAPHPISLPAISRHLKLLEDAGLVDRARDGQHRRIRLNPDAFRRGAEWFESYSRFWGESFARLAAHLENKDES